MLTATANSSRHDLSLKRVGWKPAYLLLLLLVCVCVGERERERELFVMCYESSVFRIVSLCFVFRFIPSLPLPLSSCNLLTVNCFFTPFCLFFFHSQSCDGDTLVKCQHLQTRIPAKDHRPNAHLFSKRCVKATVIIIIKQDCSDWSWRWWP